MTNAYPPPFQQPHVETKKKGNRGKITAAVAAFVGLSVVGLGLMQEPEPVAASTEAVITTTAAPTTTARPTTTTPRATTTTAETVTVYATTTTETPYFDVPDVDAPDVDRVYVPAPVPFVAPVPAPAPYVAPEPAPYVEPAEESSVSAPFANCSAAKAAGAAPVYAGDPGYGSHLDRDGDGVGCKS